MTTHIWNDLKIHERISLKAIYMIDQNQERSDRRMVAKRKFDLPTSGEKGWLNYHPLKSQSESYLQTAGRRIIEEIPMKQRDIDRWTNRQARMKRQAAIPAIHWGAIVSIIAVVAALLIIVLRAAHVL